jgi:hypothetical protein
MSYSTRQRQVILNVLRQAGRPLAPQDIREQASQDSAGIGLAMVYRALKIFIAEAVIVPVEIPDASPCYEPADRGHICASASIVARATIRHRRNWRDIVAPLAPNSTGVYARMVAPAVGRAVKFYRFQRRKKLQ